MWLNSTVLILPLFNYLRQRLNRLLLVPTFLFSFFLKCLNKIENPNYTNGIQLITNSKRNKKGIESLFDAFQKEYIRSTKAV